MTRIRLAGLLAAVLIVVALVNVGDAQSGRVGVAGGPASCLSAPSVYQTGDPGTNTGFGLQSATASTGPCITVEGTMRQAWTTTGTTEVGNKTITGNLTVTGTADITGAITTGTSVSSANWIRVGGSAGARIRIGASGNDIMLTNNDESSFNLLVLGGATAAFPAIKRSTTVMQAKLANDSAFTDFEVVDTVYGAGWNGSQGAPTKNAVYDMNFVAGVAQSYKLARVSQALDGSNPTSWAHGLTTVVAAGCDLQGTAAPALGTSTITTNKNGAAVDIYAWQPTGAGDTTLVASTGTQTIDCWAIGT